MIAKLLVETGTLRMGYSAVIAALLLASTMLAGCGSKSSGENPMQAGRVSLDQGDARTAVIHFKNAVEKAPESADARYWLGVALRRDLDPDAAEIELRKALTLGFDANLAQPELVGALLDRNAVKQAMDQIAAVPVSTPDSRAELLALTGEAHLAFGRQTEARKAFQDAQSLAPGNAAATTGLAWLLFLDGNSRDAIQTLDAVLAKHPSHLMARLLKGRLQLQSGNQKGAAETWEGAFKTYPRDVRVAGSLIPLLVAMGDVARAEEVLAQFKKESPGSRRLSYLSASIAFGKGNVAQARDLIQEARKSYPDDIDITSLSGRVEAAFGNLAFAEQQLSKVASQRPRDWATKEVLVRVLLSMNATTRAAGLVDELLKARPDDLQAVMLAGDVAVARKRYDVALKHYSKVAQGATSNVLVHLKMGDVHYLRGDAGQARREYDAALAIEPKSIAAQSALARLLVAQKDLPKAVVVAKALVADNPNNAKAQETLGTVLQASGDRDGAQKAFEAALAVQPDALESLSRLVAFDLDAGRAEAAMDRYRRVLKSNPRLFAARQALVSIMQREGKPSAEILGVIDEGIQADPASVVARSSKIDMALSIGDKKLALESAQDALSTIQDDPALLYKLARVQLATGDITQSLSTFGKLAAAGERATVYGWLGQAEVFGAQKKWAEARKAALKAVDAAPDSIDPRLALVKIDLASGQFADAVADGAELTTRWPHVSAGYLAHGAALIASGNKGKAESVLREGVNRTGDPDVLRQAYALVLATNGNAAADDIVLARLKKAPGDLAAIMVAADERMRRGQYLQAEQWYQRGLALSPEHALLLNNMAWVMARQNKPAALEFAKKALAKAPDNIAFIDTAAYLYLKSGQAAEALPLLQRIVDKAPRAPVPRLNLARGLIEAGRKSDASRQLDEVEKLSPNASEKQQLAEIRGRLSK